LPSLQSSNSDLELICKISEQFCSTGNYMESGWKETMIEKDEFIIQSLENAKPNEIIIHSDIDIQFFKNINENFNFSIFDNYDILCQADGPNTGCFGFMMMKNTENLKNMFKNILHIIKMQNDDTIQQLNDQSVLNQIYKQFNVNLGLLDYRFFSNWMTYNLNNSKFLFPDFNSVDSSNIPSNLILHHANYVIGVQTKIDLMNKIKGYQK
jgi:hypothetical protein